MKSIIENLLTFFIALTGLIGGLIWGMNSNWEPEPMIVTIVSFLEIISFIIIKSSKNNTDSNNTPPVNNSNSFTFVVNNEKEITNSEYEDRQKALTRLLFVDDNYTEFKIISILKKAGWINTKAVKDITDLDDSKVIEADIIFVDINGVGTTLFKDQGLGLASALKKKYPSKKIILYSAETTGDRFHKALKEVDSCLSKNAEPFQFINLIESYNK
ncbi:response regulator [Flavobacterium sp.]|uniref:response regulator n=1 Tax=Flavobacterium sp. TaxID=239 RepID=UPI0031D946A6